MSNTTHKILESHADGKLCILEVGKCRYRVTLDLKDATLTFACNTIENAQQLLNTFIKCIDDVTDPQIYIGIFNDWKTEHRIDYGGYSCTLNCLFGKLTARSPDNPNTGCSDV